MKVKFIYENGDSEIKDVREKKWREFRKNLLKQKSNDMTRYEFVYPTDGLYKLFRISEDLKDTAYATNVDYAINLLADKIYDDIGVLSPSELGAVIRYDLISGLSWEEIIEKYK